MGGTRKPRRAPQPAPPKFTPTQRARLLLLLILALAAFLRCYQITSIPPGLYHDEAINGNDAQENLETGRFQVFYPDNAGREGLYINLVTPLVYFFGPEAWVLRVPAIIFGILTVWGLYLLAEEMFSTSVGLLAAFFLATSFWHINFSRIGLRTIAAPCFLVWSLWLLLGAVRRMRTGKACTSRIALAAIVYGLGFYTYIAYRATPAIVVVVFVAYFFEARRENWGNALIRSAALFGVITMVVVAPLLLYFVRHPGSFTGRVSEVSLLRMPSPFLELLGNIWKLTQMIFTRGDLNWRHNISGRPVVFWPVGILFGIGIGVAVDSLGRRKSGWRPYAIALACLIITAVPAALSAGSMPHALRAIIMTPPVFLIAAAGAHRSYAWLTRKTPVRALQALAALAFLSLAYEAFHSYFEVWAVNPQVAVAFHSNGANIARQMNSLPVTHPKIVVAVEPGVLGLPSPVRTVMFLTGSYTEKQQRETSTTYVTRQSRSDPEGVEFCKQVQASLSSMKTGNLFCMLVNREDPPKF